MIDIFNYEQTLLCHCVNFLQSLTQTKLILIFFSKILRNELVDLYKLCQFLIQMFSRQEYDGEDVGKSPNDLLSTSRYSATDASVHSEKLLNPFVTVIYFKMQLKLQFGKALYCVGNCVELGAWDVQQSCRLEWTEQNIWRGLVEICSESTIEYKYLIANYSRPTEGVLKWQNGPNRILNIEDSGKDIYLSQKWNQHKIRLQLITDPFESNEEIYIIGNSVELGLWTSKRFMTREKVIESEKGERKYVWSLNFEVERERQHLHYYYIKLKDGKQVKERQPGRIFYLKDIHKNQNTSKRLVIEDTPGEIKIIDSDGFLGFKVSQINQSIFLGAALKYQEEIDELLKHDIKIVLNLQSKQDLKAHNICWKSMKLLYQKYGIKAINFEIQDMKVSDFVKKSRRLIEIMRELLLKYGTIYVHCTAGIYRSAQAVVLYLVKYCNFEVQDAIKEVKKKRPYCNPLEKCVMESLKLIEIEDEKENFFDGQSDKLVCSVRY